MRKNRRDGGEWVVGCEVPTPYLCTYFQSPSMTVWAVSQPQAWSDDPGGGALLHTWCMYCPGAFTIGRSRGYLGKVHTRRLGGTRAPLPGRLPGMLGHTANTAESSVRPPGRGFSGAERRFNLHRKGRIWQQSSNILPTHPWTDIYELSRHRSTYTK